MFKYSTKLIGKTVKIGNNNGYSIAITNCKAKISGSQNGWIRVELLQDVPTTGLIEGNLINVKPASLTLLALTVQDMQKEKSNLEEQIAELDSKINFCIINGVEEYSEDTFKAYEILKLLKLGTLKEAQAIIDILNK